MRSTLNKEVLMPLGRRKKINYKYPWNKNHLFSWCASKGKKAVSTERSNEGRNKRKGGGNALEPPSNYFFKLPSVTQINEP